MEILDSQGNVLRETDALSGKLRINFNARAGDNYTLKITGNSTDIDLDMINIVARSGTGLEVLGTSGDDTVSVVAERNLLIVNGVTDPMKVQEAFTTR